VKLEFRFLERDFYDSVLSIFKRFVYSDIFDIRKPKQQRWLTILCVCPVIDDKLRHNIVKVAVEPRAALSLIIMRVVKREKLSLTIMKNLNKLKMNDSWW